LQAAIEADGVRLLELRAAEPSTVQLFLSTRPSLSPAEIVRSIKARLQYLLRDSIPKLWRRHYALASVGDANDETLHSYVARQVEHHPMADTRVVDILAQGQFHDPRVDLAGLRASGHGQFTHSLHLVLENAEHLPDVRSDWLAKTQAMVVAACRKKEWLLSRLAMVSNHLHALVGCGVTDTPRDVVLSLMNNLAFAHGMKPVFEHSFYVGTFGPYDHNAIRRRVEEAPSLPVAGQ